MAGKPAPRKRAAAIKTPPPVALEYAEDVAGRVSDRPVPVRNGFVERVAVGSVGDPPLATMLRGGQGGAVRLKLLLAMLWFAVRHPHETSYPARGWAGLLGLDEYETNGARRITAAIDWLEARKLLRVVRSPGVPSEVYLLDERATDDKYVLPFLALQEKKEAGEELSRDDLYITLPPEFFTKGWIAVLSAPAVAMLLVMVLEARYSGRVDRLWHSPAQAERRFGLSEDTRGAGLAELVLYGVVDKKTAPVSPGVFDMKRRRNIYDLHLEQLLVEPGQPRPNRQITAAELEESAGAADGVGEVAAEAEAAPHPSAGIAANGKRTVRVKKKVIKAVSKSSSTSRATGSAPAG